MEEHKTTAITTCEEMEWYNSEVIFLSHAFNGYLVTSTLGSEPKKLAI